MTLQMPHVYRTLTVPGIISQDGNDLRSLRTSSGPLITSTECKETYKGTEYAGSIDVSRNGVLCQRWDKQVPNEHDFTDAEEFPDETLADAANFCRNPDRDRKPWCLLADNTLYDVCVIPYCTPEFWCELNLGVALDNYTASTEEADRPASSGGIEETTGWCANETDTAPFLQLDFLNETIVSYVKVKGEDVTSTRRTTKYKLQFLSPDGVSWATYSSLEPGYTEEQIFIGNVDNAESEVGIGLTPPIWTTSLRIQPIEWVGRSPCVRIGAVGCEETHLGHPRILCENGGTLVITAASTAICYCPTLYGGNFCETHVDACTLFPCENGGTCVVDPGAPMTIRNCTCLDLYSGDSCEIGYATSCNHLADNGANVTDFYTIKLFDGKLTANTPSDARLRILTGPACAMVAISEHLRWNAIGPARPYTLTYEECTDWCLADNSCAFILYEPDSSECLIYAGSNAISAIVTSDPSAAMLLVERDCPEPTKLLCNFSDPLRPRLTIRHHVQPADTYTQAEGGYYFSYPGISREQLQMLRVSAYCSQSVSVTCHTTSTDRWWLVTFDSEPHELAQPATVADSWCACVFIESCTTDGDKCSCNDRSPHTDGGTITEASILPVTQLRYEGSVSATPQTALVSDFSCQEAPAIDECSPDPCENDGACTDMDYDFQCICSPGYTGKTCAIDINECLSAPCLHGAECSDLRDMYQCPCLDGYEGVNCEVDIDECASNPCMAVSSCVDGVNQYRCVCKPGYTGDICEIEVDECQSEPCQHGGTCADSLNLYTCVCPDDFEGSDCELVKDFCVSSPCQNGATCEPFVGVYTCDCPAGFAGVSCERDIDECVSAPCQNAGTCLDQVNGFECTCPAGFSGVTCQTDIDDCVSDPCQYGGTCADGVNLYRCLCTAGYSGENCNIEDDECLSRPCYNSGTCSDHVNEYTCNCLVGYYGLTCSSETNECMSSPCHNDGTCVDELAGFTCTCSHGYAGTLCDLLAIDGQWAGWGAWGECSNKCGVGVLLRTRKCTNPPPQNGGNHCEGTAHQTKDCQQYNCVNVDGEWGLWGEFSPCSSTCGPGMKTRTRRCSNPAPTGTGRQCQGDRVSESSCQTAQCGLPLDGFWSQWGVWSECSKSCDLGEMFRSRLCDRPRPVFGGKDCAGDSRAYRPCFNRRCQETPDCDEWSQWSACSTACGDGRHTRERLCKSRPGVNSGGKTLKIHTKHQTETAHCQAEPCPVMKCYHCESELDFDRGHMTCKGPAKACPVTQPYCLYAFSDSSDGRKVVRKGCGDDAQCGNVSDTCKRLQNLTITSIISDDKTVRFPVEPHKDTMHMGLRLTEDCSICCKTSKCNRGMLPPFYSVYSGSASIWRLASFAPVVMSYVIHLLLV